MPTARARMLELSPLVGAHAARAHFLAITTGTGATIFVSQMAVVSETQQRTLYVKPKRGAIEAAKPKSPVQVGKGSKNLFLRAEREEQTVFTEHDQMYIADEVKQSFSFTSPSNIFVTRRKTVN